MSRKFLTHIDLNQNELQNGVLQNLPAAPANPKAGQIYFDTVMKVPRTYDGVEWIAGETTVVTKDSTATSAGIIQLSNGTDRKLADYVPSSAGIVKVSAGGVADIAVANTDYLPATTGSAIQKSNGTGGLTAAVAGTDFVAATTGTAMQKADGSGGLVAAVANTDYLPATTGAAIQKSNSNGGLVAAVANTDYLPATTGSAIQKADGAGGLVSAVAGTDYVGATSGTAILKADGLGQTTSAIAGTDYAAATSGTTALKGNGAGGFDNATLNDVLSPTAAYSFNNQLLNDLADPVDPQDAATKFYVDSVVSGALAFQDVIDASTNPPNPTATAVGQYWVVSAAGTVGGQPAGVGDLVLCTSLSPLTFDIIPNTQDVATTDLAGAVKLATLEETEAKVNAAKAVVPADLANFPIKRIFTIGDGAATSIAVTHSLNTQDVIVQVREAATNAVVECDITNSSVSTVTLGFVTAPALDALKVVVIG